MKNLKRALEKFGKETCEKIRRDIRYKKLVKTGRLVGSIDFKVVNKNGSYEVEFYMVDYGKFLDEGTRYIKAQKFFRETIDEQLDKYSNNFLDAMAKDVFDKLKTI
jgi:HK97 gp10 family phage protein